MFRDVWIRATASQPALTPVQVAVVGVVVLLITWSPVGYRMTRHLVTLAHEAGHALVAALSGRRLRGIRLHSDTSGLTLTRGRPRGPGMVATTAAGYPAPALVGLAGAFVLVTGHAAALLWLLVLTCAVMLVLVRNLYGLWVVLVIGAGVGALSWWAPQVALTWVATALVWILLLAAPRSVIEVQRQRVRGRAGGSDVDQLASLTRLPAGLWVVLFGVCCLGCLALGGWLMLAG